MKKAPFPDQAQQELTVSAYRGPRQLRLASPLLRFLVFMLALLSPWAASRVQAAAPKPGDIITIAGQNIGDNGPASEARLASTTACKGIVKDAAGNLYISDSAHNAVRRVDAAT